LRHSARSVQFGFYWLADFIRLLLDLDLTASSDHAGIGHQKKEAAQGSLFELDPSSTQRLQEQLTILARK
jgi:hypothetical protein